MSKSQFKSSLVGDIPTDWECVKLDSLVSSLVSGVSVSGEDRVPLNSEKMLLKVSAVTSGKFNSSAFKTVDTETGARLKRKVENNTILVNRANGSRGLVGSAVYISDITDTLYFPDKIWKITPNSATGNGPFLGHLLSSNRFRNKVIARCSGGTGMMNIGSKSYLGIRIPSPPLPEQEKIADVLGTWDRTIETQQNLIDSLTRRKKALTQQLLTGKTRLPGFEDEWKTYKASELFGTRSEKNHAGFQILSATQDCGIVTRASMERKISADKANEKGYKVVCPGDFIISLRSFQGGLEYSNLKGAISPAYHVLISKEGVHDDYFRHFFKSYEFIGRLALAVIGIRDGKQISFKDFSFLKFTIPSVGEQQSIAKVLTAADEEIQLHTTHLTSLRTQKRGLMQQLLTGKTRVTL